MEHAKQDSCELKLSGLPSHGSAPIDLFSWQGDTSSIIREMKLRAGCEFDRELARFLGKGHSAVAQWRRRGVVPEVAILRFEARLRAR